MISSSDIQKLRDLPIEGVAERLGLTVSRHKSLCPFHDDSRPSLTFNVRRNTYRCFVCDAHGGTIDLVMNHLHKPFYEACRWLADEGNVLLDTWRPIRKPSAAIRQPSVDTRHLSMLIAQPCLNEEARHFLFDERRLHPAVVRWLGISSISSPVPMSSDYRSSWFNAPSLLIPYRDIDGKLLSVQARYLGDSRIQEFKRDSKIQNRFKNSNVESLNVAAPESLNPKPRFQFPRGCQCHIFNLPVLKLLKPDEELWISEGVSDCMALLSSGKKAIAIPSATLLKDDDVKSLHSLHEHLGTTFHIYPDQDAPGERLYLELKERLPNIAHHQLPEGYKDFGQWWASR